MVGLKKKRNHIRVGEQYMASGPANKMLIGVEGPRAGGL